MRLTPLVELEGRIARLQAGLADVGLQGAMFVQGADVFYLAGTAQQCHLLVPVEGEPHLLVRRDFARARSESPLGVVEPLTSLRDLPGRLARAGIDPAGAIGLELDVLPVLALRRYESLLPSTRFVDCSPFIRRTRSVKSAFEVEAMREAAVIADLVMREAAAHLAEGMTELSLSAHLERVAREAGHQGVVRFRAFGQELPIMHVLSGPEAATRSGMDTPLSGRGLAVAAPQGAGLRPIGRGEPVVIDVCGAVHGYMVDQTRVLSVGPLPTSLRDAYAACLDLHGFLMRHATPGRRAGEVFEAVARRVAGLGYEDHFMGPGGDAVAFVGHGVGLEADEDPVIGRGRAETLERGNVIAVEPKMVFPGFGAVGVEDTCLLTDDGLEPITFADRALVEV